MWLHATDPCCIKQHPKDYSWFMDGYLKLMGFVGDPSPLQVDDVLQATNSDYNGL